MIRSRHKIRHLILFPILFPLLKVYYLFPHLYPGHSHQEVDVAREVVQAGPVDLECGERLVQSQVDLAQLQEGGDHRLLLDGRLELSLRVPHHAQPEVALAQGHLPEPVLVPGRQDDMYKCT